MSDDPDPLDALAAEYAALQVRLRAAEDALRTSEHTRDLNELLAELQRGQPTLTELLERRLAELRAEYGAQTQGQEAR